MRDQISYNPTPDDLRKLEQLAAQNRRDLPDMVRIILEDVVDGRLDISDITDSKPKRRSRSVGVSSEFKRRVDAFRGNVSVDKLLHRALIKLTDKPPQNK